MEDHVIVDKEDTYEKGCQFIWRLCCQAINEFSCGEHGEKEDMNELRQVFINLGLHIPSETQGT